MAVNIQRQQAFAAAFNSYPDVLERFVEDNVTLYNPLDKSVSKYSNLHEKQSLMAILMAQFITRLIQTRVRHCVSPLLHQFAQQTVDRYKDYTTGLIGGRVMQADSKYALALNTLEQSMSNVIFTALMKEVEIDEIAEENHNQNREFEEVDFWHDVMLGLGSYYRKNRHPQWWRVTQEMFLDHKPEFKKALEDENRIIAEQELANVVQQPVPETKH